MDTKTEFNLNNIIATLSLISISSPANVLKLGLNSARWMLACIAAARVTKSPDYTGGFVCLRSRLDECQSWWASTVRAMPPWRHNLYALRLVRSKTIDLFSTTSLESQESYLTTGMLPYKHSSFFPPTHGSIMLSPRQPRVFARLARWQLTTDLGQVLCMSHLWSARSKAVE